MKNIALALSGGGFRAASFSLGTLSYLQHSQLDGKPLLDNVTFMGSTSGGSLTNIVYNLGIRQGKSFSEIYHSLLSMVDGEELLKKVFQILSDPGKWTNRGEKSQNLINAFSIAYDDLLAHAEFNTLFGYDAAANPVQKEVCVNATEFTNGLSFRFQSQKPGATNGRIGNNYIYFNDTTVGGQLLLADIMACSSCFSGGFEPFIFPDDFVHDKLDRTTLSNSLCFTANPFTIETPLNDILADKDFKDVKNRFGLMDGGVADNQAIDSIFKANGRRKAQDAGFDLIILTDVTSYFIDGYDLLLEKKNWTNAFTLGQVKTVLAFLGLFSVGLISWVTTKGWLDWIRFVFIPVGTAALFYLYSLWKVRKQRRTAFNEKSTWSIVLFTYINYFLTIRYSRVKQMVASRLSSLFLLANDLYLKQLRRLYYEKIYADPILRDITISNAIYDLSAAKQKAKADEALSREIRYEALSDPDVTGVQAPAKNVIAIAETARLMPTTLWFDQFQKDDETLKKIVATGQFTTCYNLLKYLTKKEKLAPLPPELTALKASLADDWMQFNADPYFLYDHLNSTVKNTNKV